MKHYLILVVVHCVLFAPDLYAQASVRVEAGTFLRTWETMPLGLNLNTLTDGAGNLRPDARPLADAIGDTGVRYLRFPGGEKSDVYEWAAPPYEDPSTSGLLRKGDPNDWPFNDIRFWDPAADTWANDNYDFDEFMMDCQAAGAEAVISVAFDGMYKPATDLSTAHLTKEQALEMAVAWVRYANVKKKYGIKYWMLGNETWNGTTYAGAEPGWAKYGQDVAEFAAAMKEVDPTILIGINGDNSSQLDRALDECAHVIDFIDVHTYPAFYYYPEKPASERVAYYSTYTDYLDTLINPLDIVGTAQNAINQVSDPTDRERLFIAVMETSATGFSKTTEWSGTNNLGQALANFDILAQLAQDERVNIIQFWNSRWLPPYGDESHSYDLFTSTNELNASGKVLSILTDELLDGMVATESTDRVRTFATQSTDEQQLTVFLLNKDTLASPTELAVDGVSLTAKAGRSVFTGPEVAGVVTTYDMVDSVALNEGSVEVILPPTSLTVLRFGQAETSSKSLPVELINFRGEVSGEETLLEWTAVESADFLGYGLERRVASTAWEPLVFLTARHDDTETAYRFTDADAPSAYYRLRLEEADGTFNYSDAIWLDRPNDGLEAPYPNPTTGPVHVADRYRLTPYQVFSRRGRIVQQGTVPADGIVSLSGLPRGIYQLVLGESSRFRLVKR